MVVRASGNGARLSESSHDSGMTKLRSGTAWANERDTTMSRAKNRTRPAAALPPRKSRALIRNSVQSAAAETDQTAAEVALDQSLTWSERDALFEEHYDSASRCPTCQSANTRESRYRREDGLARRFFFGAHRCRRCGRRYFEARRSTVGGSVAAAFATFTLFVALGSGVIDIRDVLRPSADPAQLAAGDTTSDGSFNPRSIERRAELEDAAEAGDADSQFELGRLYLDEHGGLQDLAQARSWVSRAAEQGHVGAQSLLGHMYHAGRGALQSFTLAHDWLLRAARQNDAVAQFSLGLMYREGQAVPADPVAAYSWFNLAASQGLEDAREARDDLLSALTPAQVLAAQTASEQWKPGDLQFNSERMLASSAAE